MLEEDALDRCCCAAMPRWRCVESGAIGTALAKEESAQPRHGFWLAVGFELLLQVVLVVLVVLLVLLVLLVVELKIQSFCDEPTNFDWVHVTASEGADREPPGATRSRPEPPGATQNRLRMQPRHGWTGLAARWTWRNGGDWHGEMGPWAGGSAGGGNAGHMSMANSGGGPWVRGLDGQANGVSGELAISRSCTDQCARQGMGRQTVRGSTSVHLSMALIHHTHWFSFGRWIAISLGDGVSSAGEERLQTPSSVALRMRMRMRMRTGLIRFGGGLVFW
ncbi:uncharacterized protein BJ171DRAFT_620978 [Polychytrium aggregatum]|uniref:uncharacterized protein n=1 Tax=Polychytrium aggregatum TaxID=110093 RepID=UPI0022FE76C1|nr:uncharacterized protein BJ171DRAFT_620978 [Polychytrium aggregatum]KAI9209499.1 hypothetical protein BJ171DRAFT_620978 [Polychytrium aggregatum]